MVPIKMKRMTNIKWSTEPGTQLSLWAYLTLLTFTSLHVTEVTFSINWRWECERDVAGECLNLLNALWDCVYQGTSRERGMSQKVNSMSVCVRREKKQVNVREWGICPHECETKGSNVSCLWTLTCLIYAVHLATCGPPMRVILPSTLLTYMCMSGNTNKEKEHINYTTRILSEKSSLWETAGQMVHFLPANKL